MESVRICLRLEFINKNEKKMKQQSKTTFNGVLKSYEICDSYSFKQTEDKMDKPFYLGFAVLELSKQIKYNIYSDKLQPRFGQEYIQLHYTDTDSFVLSMKTENTIKDLKNWEEIIDFSNLDENHEIFRIKNNKVAVIIKRETPTYIWIDEYNCLGSKAFSFICGDDVKIN